MSTTKNKEEKQIVELLNYISLILSLIFVAISLAVTFILVDANSVFLGTMIFVIMFVFVSIVAVYTFQSKNTKNKTSKKESK